MRALHWPLTLLLLILLLHTLVASLTSMIAWYYMDMVFTPHKPTTKGINIAIICGLVGITPSAGFVGLWDSALNWSYCCCCWKYWY
jgi:ammonia channel protein AmtB